MLAASTLATAASDKPVQLGSDLLAKWKAQSDLHSLGSVPFRLKAKFELLGMRKGDVSGTLEELFFAPDRWRLDITFPGYQEIVIRNGPDRFWRTRSLTHTPLRITQTKELFGFQRPVRTVEAEYKIDDVRERKVKGEKLMCVRRTYDARRQELCFDSEARVMRTEDQGIPTKIEEFSQYRAFGGKQVPDKLRLRIAGAEVVRAELLSLEPYVGSAQTVLIAGSDFEERVACDAATPPKPEYTPDPSYSESARAAHVQGSVVLAGEVGLDGRIHDATVLQAVGAGLDETALQAVRMWRFKPGTCKGSPIPFELNVEVNFRLGL